MSTKAIRDAMQSATRFHQAGEIDRAEQIYQQILRVQPGNADALHLLGVTACQRGQFQRALELIAKAITLAPNESGYHNSLGNALRGVGRSTEAIAAFRRACELHPRNLAALNNLAVALDDDDQTQLALECFDRLIAENADIAQWHANRGTVQVNAGQLPAAIESQRKAIALQPGLAGAHAKLATALLSCGQFAEGWKEFAWRFRAGVIVDPTAGDSAPIWDGSPIDGKTLLIKAEQGFGDFLQCVRYVPLVAQQGATVLLRCQPELKSLLQRGIGTDQVVSTDEPIPPHDYQVPIFSLPPLFRADEQSIPWHIPYITADPQKAARYAATGSAKRVGLVWAGSPGHGNDHRRSCPAQQYNALAGIEGIEFYRLQMPASLPAPSGLALVDPIAEFSTFDDTAALVANLDLVISVDTSVAHLAGAMGKPLWILLPFAAEWRWMTGREDSPWYPTARLFRQSSPGDWTGVLQRVRTALQAIMAVPA